MTKSKKTKRALLGSVLALVLCFVMLLGTTFAWFTDTASTGVNKIEAGTLKVELLDEDDNSLEGQTLKFIQAKDNKEKAPVESVLWEPGCTYELQPVTIRNAGNLALKYKIVISAVNGSLSGEETDANLADVIDVYMNGEKKGTLTEALTSTDNDGYAWGTLSAGDRVGPLTISLQMQETAGNKYQNLYIDNIAVTVYAKQWTEEYDSINNQYDKNATYSDVIWDGVTTTPVTKAADGKYHINNAAELAWLVGGEGTIPADSTVVLESDIDLNGATIKGYNNGVFDSNFDGQGHTVSNFTVATESGTGYYCGLFPYLYDGCSVKNLTVKNATSIANVNMVGAIVGGAYGGSTVENCHAVNCTVIGAKKVGAVVGYIATNTTKDCFATDCVVYCANSDENQSGEVVGYQDNCTATNIKATNVTVKRGVTPALVSSVAELKEALENGKTAVLLSNLTYNNTDSGKQLIFETTNSINFDGNGKTITMSGANPSEGKDSYLAFISSAVNVSNLTVTGEGLVEVGDYNSKNGNRYVENLVIQNMKSTTGIKGFNDKGFKLGVAFMEYGTTTLKNCKMTGTTAMVEGAMAVDAGFDNDSTATVEGGEYGVVYCWSKANVTFENGAEVKTLYVAPVDKGKITIKSGTTVNKIVVDYGTYSSNTFLVNKTNLKKLVIEDGAEVSEIVYGNNTYDVTEWNNYVENLS